MLLLTSWTTPLKRLFTARTYTLAPCTIVALSVSYYFLIVLPRDKRERLEIERQKLVDLETAKKKEQINEDLLESCIQQAEVRYWEDIKLNGTEVKGKPGTYRAPTYIFDSAERKKRDDIDLCYRKYRRQ